jgi:hypothetical protein
VGSRDARSPGVAASVMGADSIALPATSSLQIASSPVDILV